MSGVVPFAGLEMERHQLEHAHVRAFEVLEARPTLIGEGSDDVSREYEEARPGDERQEQPRIDACLERGRAIEPDERLEEGNEYDNEDRGKDGAPPAEVEPSGDDRQIVEREEGDLFVDEPMDRQHGAH